MVSLTRRETRGKTIDLEWDACVCHPRCSRARSNEDASSFAGARSGRDLGSPARRAKAPPRGHQLIEGRGSTAARPPGRRRHQPASRPLSPSPSRRCGGAIARRGRSRRPA
eukprot:7346271-Pyramimonas_sp.AAC.1